MFKFKGFKQVIIGLLFCLFSITLYAQTPNYDFVILNATVFDGSGNKPVVCDVAISNDTIAFVGKLKKPYQATQVIKAKKLYLSPGFIDPHTHYNAKLTDKNPKERMLPRVLMQGVTTVFSGNDGSGPTNIKAAQQKIVENGIGPNQAFLIGHNSVRRAVIGLDDVKPTPEQMEKMKGMVEKAMKDGAFGISTGLFYTPGNYADEDEVVALSKVAARYGGIYDTHQRDEGSQSIGIVNSVKEVLNIGYKAHIPLHFSHIKLSGPEAWTKRDSVVNLIENAQKNGLTVTANQYTYIASQTSLIAALVPTWARDGGTNAMRERYKDPVLLDSIKKGIEDNIKARVGTADKLIITIKSRKDITGKNIQQIADRWKISPVDAVIKITSEVEPSVISFSMQESDVEYFMKKPWVMTGSDGGNVHPRGHATFTRLIEEYTVKRHIFPLTYAIYRSSYLTAKTFNIKKRGLIKPGYYADLFLFDIKKYKANNDFENGEVLSSGVKYLWVNGKLALDNEVLAEPLSGRGLKLNE